MPDGDRASSGVKLTYDDYLLFPEDGKRHELIDGEHYVTPSPGLRHQDISGRLHLAIGTWLRSHPIGRVYYAPLDVIFSDYDVVEPDLLYASHERASQIMTETWVTGAPELVIEIGSPSTRTRDETIKLRLYEKFGVLEYWVVDPRLEAVRVFRVSDPVSRRGQRLITGHSVAPNRPLLTLLCHLRGCEPIAAALY